MAAAAVVVPVVDASTMSLNKDNDHSVRWQAQVDRRVRLSISLHSLSLGLLMIQIRERWASDKPVLLLEGDVLRVIDGVARTRYRMETAMNATSDRMAPITIEESHELVTGRKRYALRPDMVCYVGDREDSVVTDSSSVPDLALIDVQEFTSVHSREASASRVDWTGGSTWESSVAMALHFASNPHELRGRVLELGSGVGVGGILLLTLQQHASRVQYVKSLTLTDGNDSVVTQCRENVARATSQLAHKVPIDVRHLNWNEDLQHYRPDEVKFDTILASDCVYCRDDIPTLVGAMTGLLKIDDDQNASRETALGPSRIHVFSPLNRSVLPEFVCALKFVGMQVAQETIKIRRSRLGTQGEVCSSILSTFAHVTASYGQALPATSLNDVD